LEGHDLRGGAGAVAFGKEHVVILSAIERRVEIDQVNRLVINVLPQDGQVVAVIKLIFPHRKLILAWIPSVNVSTRGSDGLTESRLPCPKKFRAAGWVL